ncbi:MAG: GNAT family N-acetyltransferase [Rickettsiales bacterium]|nr:GNAT family N-acetyltransferase [Rickettsiales bacterium]
MIKADHDTADKSELVIRSANRTDSATLAEFARYLAKEEGRQGSSTSETIAQAIDAQQAEFLLAWQNEKPLGMLMFYMGYDLESASAGAHLGDIFVMREARRQGVARTLMATMAQLVSQRGGTWISLTVLQQNKEAIKLYKALAMQEVDVRFMAIGVRGLREWILSDA